MNFGRLFGKRFLKTGRRFFTEKIQKIEVITQQDKKQWYQKAVERPFRTYFRIGGATFGFCLLSNMATSLFDSSRRELVVAHPDLFSLSLLSKSCYFGLFWPSFYLKSILRPKEAFCLYGGLENMTEQFGQEMEMKGTINGREMTGEEMDSFKKEMAKLKREIKEMFGK